MHRRGKGRKMPAKKASGEECTLDNEQTGRGKLQRLLLPQGGALRPPPGLPLSNVQASEAS